MKVLPKRVKLPGLTGTLIESGNQMAQVLANLTDDELVQGFRDTDQKDGYFRELSDRHSGPVLTFLTKFMHGDVSAAEDAMQQSLVKLFEQLENPPEELKVRQWLYATGSNFAKDAMRWASRHDQAISLNTWQTNKTAGGESLGYDPEDADQPEPWDIMAETEYRQRVVGLLDTLDEGDREAIEAVYFDGQTFFQAADQMGIPRGSFKTRIHRALRKLKNQLLDRDDQRETIAA